MVFIWWQTHNKNYLDVNFNETNEKNVQKGYFTNNQKSKS